jgi:predicted aconitase
VKDIWTSDGLCDDSKAFALGDKGGRALELTAHERQLLAGEHGSAVAMAMAIIVRMGALAGAHQLVEVSAAHIDSCLYHGTVGLDLAERLAAEGGRVTVPTTLNVAALDLLHPELVRLDSETRGRARRLMDAYVAMGCEPTWTCAPYQLPSRPTLGEHVAWAESNAIVFANSVLGARTGRYGDFIDICAALAGRVPLAGLHVAEERRARVVFRLSDDVLARVPAQPGGDEWYGLIGSIVGREVGSLVPAIVGLSPDTSEDQLKALGAGAASSGAVGMFHAVGVTPEAPTLDAACGGAETTRQIEISTSILEHAWEELSTWDGGTELSAVSIGTPHFSVAEFDGLDRLLDGRPVNPQVDMYVSTGRAVLGEIERSGLLERLVAAGITIVADTCTYITPIMSAGRGSAVMTNSAKWAWYAPGNLGVEVIYGSLADCVASAVKGGVVRERPAYLDG